MPFNISLGRHMYYTEQWMGGRGGKRGKGKEVKE